MYLSIYYYSSFFSISVSIYLLRRMKHKKFMRKQGDGGEGGEGDEGDNERDEDDEIDLGQVRPYCSR